MKRPKTPVEGLPVEAFLPLARNINALLRFRLRKWQGLEEPDAVHPEMEVRLLDAWLQDVAGLDAEQDTKVSTEPIPGQGATK
jgi:hypothetical protein